MEKRSVNWMIVVGCFLLALAVALGAFGSHGIRGQISQDAFRIYDTMVTYLFYHSFALVIAGIIGRHSMNGWILWAGRLFSLGILFFCGSLILLTVVKALVLPGFGWIGPITPLGGLGFIGGWLSLAIGISRKN